jgi:gamma-glutamylcyclotransferase (GGCT)/AIG2-like uncharacterized protein YtfP
MAAVNPDRLRQLAELLRRLDDARNGDSTQERADASNRAYAQAAAITGSLPEATSHEGNHSDYFGALSDWLKEPSTIYVFVYGTLKRGNYNNRLLEGSVFVEEAKVKGYGLTPGGGFPYAIPCQNMTARGEVYAVEDHTMARLDGLEGFPYHYTRDWVDVTLRCGMVVQAWLYVSASPDHQRHRGTLVESWDQTPFESRYMEVDDA